MSSTSLHCPSMKSMLKSIVAPIKRFEDTLSALSSVSFSSTLCLLYWWYSWIKGPTYSVECIGELQHLLPFMGDFPAMFLWVWVVKAADAKIYSGVRLPHSEYRSLIFFFLPASLSKPRKHTWSDRVGKYWSHFRVTLFQELRGIKK